MTEPSPPQLDTPAMRQYRSFKEQYPDYVLLFRMGDFYELFYDDAKLASRELGLALTSRSKGPSAVPLAGIPYHALDSYLARLIRNGHRVAICEQVEDPRQAKGVVKRDVTRLVTPGTLTEEELLEKREGNYLAAVHAPSGAKASGKDDAAAGLAWAELSSGTFWACELGVSAVLDELVRIRPAELLVAEGGRFDEESVRAAVRESLSATCTRRPGWAFDGDTASTTLCGHFRTATLEGFGFEAASPALAAAGALIEYLQETQKTALGHIQSLRRMDRGEFMLIDGNTLRCLEVHRTLRGNRRQGSLLESVDRTRTGMGARLLERWLNFPLRRFSEILARQDAIEELIEDRPRLAELRELLGEIAQIDRIAAGLAMGRSRPRELLALGESLALCPRLIERLEGSASGLLAAIPPRLQGLDAVAERIQSAIDPDCPNTLRDGGVMAAGFDERLDRLRSIGTDGQHWLGDYQARLSEQTGIATLKVGYNKVFGYYIEVGHAHAEKVPASFVRKQTLKNAERYITDELKRYESEVLGAEERARQLEAELFEALRSDLAEHVPALQAAAESLAMLDVLASLAVLAVDRRWHRPTITQDDVLEISGGRHPVLDEQLAERFVPNDVQMGSRKDRLLIITGPNMAGKSTYIRQVALLVLLAQTGSFIPAESATIGLADRIFTRVGAADELARGLSTFMLEMVETANILNNATRRSLVILDEVGRGTGTCDGLALAWAICEHIALNLRCRTLFATHYHELTELEEVLDGTRNLNVAVREWADEVIFLHKIAEGGTDRSYGVHVARLAGVPQEVIRRAREIMPQIQARLAESLNMPDLAERARRQSLFADPATRVARELRGIDPDQLSPAEAHELIRKLKSEL